MPAPDSILPPSLSPGRARPLLSLGETVGVAQGRVHEICGPARRTLAVMLAARAAGPVLWALPAWRREYLYPPGLAAFLDPARLIRAACPKPVDLLWTAEEALRSGAVGAVVAELEAPPALTPVRRLQLAAEAGGGRVTAFLLTPETGGAPGVESRWHAAPRPGGGWRLRRLRARMAPEAEFDLPDSCASAHHSPAPLAPS